MGQRFSPFLSSPPPPVRRCRPAPTERLRQSRARSHRRAGGWYPAGPAATPGRGEWWQSPSPSAQGSPSVRVLTWASPLLSWLASPPTWAAPAATGGQRDQGPTALATATYSAEEGQLTRETKGQSGASVYPSLSTEVGVAAAPFVAGPCAAPLPKLPVAVAPAVAPAVAAPL